MERRANDVQSQHEDTDQSLINNAGERAARRRDKPLPGRINEITTEDKLSTLPTEIEKLE